MSALNPEGQSHAPLSIQPAPFLHSCSNVMRRGELHEIAHSVVRATARTPSSCKRQMRNLTRAEQLTGST